MQKKKKLFSLKQFLSIVSLNRFQDVCLLLLGRFNNLRCFDETKQPVSKCFFEDPSPCCLKTWSWVEPIFSQHWSQSYYFSSYCCQRHLLNKIPLKKVARVHSILYVIFNVTIQDYSFHNWLMHTKTTFKMRSKKLMINAALELYENIYIKWFRHWF